MSVVSDNSNEQAAVTAPAVDAVIKVTVGEGNMSACVNISPPLNGGSPPTAEALAEALKDKVTANINQVKLRMLMLKPVYNQDVVIAAGTEPVNGEDGAVIFKVQVENNGKPREKEDGKIDYYNLGLIENVRKGQVLCIIKPPTDGTPGMTVKGEVLRQKPGKPAVIATGPNTELSADETRILSKIDGHFEYDGRRVSVNDTYTLKQDVDTSTGNLKAAGNLIIHGSITSGFTVEAGGFVTVAGIVEASTVISGGNMNLQGGATGSTIKSGGNLKSKFTENCNIYVGGDFNTEYVLNSSVRCKRNLKTEGIISKIIGGCCIVGLNVECRTIGSAAGVKTILEIGNDPEVIERQHYLTNLIPELEKQMKSLEPLLKLLKQLALTNRLDEEKAETLEKANYSYNSHSDTIQNAKNELSEINAALINKNYGKILCTDTIFPGTVVTIGSANYTVTNEMLNASLYYSDGYVAVGSAR